MGCTMSGDVNCSSKRIQLKNNSKSVDNIQPCNSSNKQSEEDKYCNEKSIEEQEEAKNAFHYKDLKEGTKNQCNKNSLYKAKESEKEKESEKITEISVKLPEPNIKIEVIEKSVCNNIDKDPIKALMELGYDLQVDYDDDGDYKRQNHVRQLVIPSTNDIADRFYKESTNEDDPSYKI